MIRKLQKFVQTLKGYKKQKQKLKELEFFKEETEQLCFYLLEELPKKSYTSDNIKKFLKDFNINL